MHRIKLTLNSTIEDGKYKGNTVDELINSNSGAIILELIKNGYEFDDDVLEKAHIKRFIRDVHTITEIVEKTVTKDTKVYPKDTDNIKKIMDSILTLNNGNFNEYNDSNVSLEEIKDIPDLTRSDYDGEE